MFATAFTSLALYCLLYSLKKKKTTTRKQLRPCGSSTMRILVVTELLA